MPTMRINGTQLYYEAQGTGPESVVFAPGLLLNSRMFDRQVSVLKHRYSCITFDFRGHGQSEVTTAGYDMDALTEDAAVLITQVVGEHCHFCGFSTGGFVALRLALRYPELLDSLILIDTSADPEPWANQLAYRLLSLAVRCFGLRAVEGSLLPRIFSQRFLEDPAYRELRERWRAYLLTNDRTGVVRAASGMIKRKGVYDMLDNIHVPTLIIVGEKDETTPPTLSQRMHERLPHSKLIVIPDAGHLTTVEASDAVNTALKAFLGTTTRN